ncbi:MAG: hypothetical protein ABEN55_06795 [Bradymonadaceae bacterium]
MISSKPKPLLHAPELAPCPACGSNDVAVYTDFGRDVRPFGQCQACERAYTMAKVVERPMGPVEVWRDRGQSEGNLIELVTLSI